VLEKAWRGREMFRRVRPVLLAAGRVVDRIPRRGRQWLLVRLRNADGYVPLALRYVLLRSLAASCGDNVAVYAGVHLHNPSELRIGSNVKIGEMGFLGAAGTITIGDDVSIAHGCSLLTETHDLEAAGPIRDTPLGTAPIVLQRGSLLGAGCRVLAGVTIGEHAMIGAGSVVTTDVPPYAIAAGVPARVIRYRSSGDADGDRPVAAPAG
jgi:acetyltransferase-like isoleucine patch superfamily enzyme